MPDVRFSNQYPYTDFHELNLDWVIKEVKFWSERVGKSIRTIELTGTVGLVDTYTITYSDGTTSTFDVTNGNGITSVAKTGTAGLVDTYTITFQDGSTSTFDVTNGAAAVDPTFSLTDYAADAKATGDAIGNLSPYTTTYESGKYIRPDGTVGNYAGHSASWYINVDGIKIIYVLNTSETSPYNAFYDSNYQFISSFTTADGIHVYVPNNAVYARLTKNNDDTTFEIYPFPMSISELTENLSPLLHSKPAELDYVTPQMYGALGDGVHDDTAAIQAAFNSGYKRVIIPRTSDYYLVTDKLTISNPSMIIEGSSGIDFTDSDLPCITATVSKWTVIELADTAKFTQIKNLKIDCDNKTNVGIYHDRTTNNFINDLLFENVFIQDAIDYGVYLGAVYKSTFINIRTLRANRGIVIVGASNNYACTSCALINCYTDYATSEGIVLNNVVYSSLISCATDHTKIAYSFTKTKGISLIGCGCERCETALYFHTSDQNVNTNIIGFTQLLDTSTATYDSTIYCGQVQNLVISGLSTSSSDNRSKVLTTTTSITSIVVLDNSIDPAKCSLYDAGHVRFLSRDLIYSASGSPLYEGQIAIDNGIAYISVLDNGQLTWKAFA